MSTHLCNELRDMLGLDYSSDEESCGAPSNGHLFDKCEVKENVLKISCTEEKQEIIEVFAEEQQESIQEEESIEKDKTTQGNHNDLDGENIEVFYSKEDVKKETMEKCREYLSLQGFDLTESIRSKKDFGNPHILDVVVEYFKIDEIGSNYPKDKFDPHGYKKCDFEDEIREFNMKNQEAPISSLSSSCNEAPPEKIGRKRKSRFSDAPP